ncbi:MAG: S8 family serine peptidase [Armatimonadota bacterium]
MAIAKSHFRKASVGTLAIAVALVALIAPAAADHPRWPTVTVSGPRPFQIYRHGVLVTRPVEARADRLIVKLRWDWVEKALRGQVVLEHVLGGDLARFWRTLGMVSIKVQPDRLYQTLDLLRRNPAVEAADLDYLVYPAYVPDTPDYRKQYHHDLIATPRAWDAMEPDAWRKCVIAIVDTGVDLDHPDLVDRIWVNADEIPGNGIDDDNNGFIDDVYGWDFYNNANNPQPEPDGEDQNFDGVADEQASHGTLSAGLAAAKVYDNWGTAGVYPNARIMSVKVFPDDGGTDYETVVDGIIYAIDNGAEVINLSLGAPWSTLFTDPIVRAHQKDIVVTAAAGNYNRELTDTELYSPVCNEGPNPLTDNYVIGVAYTDKYDRKGSYSNYDGSTGRHFVDVSAPGDNVYGPAYYDPAIPGFGSYFYSNTGTSFSAPFVAGLAALVKALHPSYGPDEIRDRIVSTADDIDRLNPGYKGKLGSGRINCARALGIDLAPRPPTNLRAYDTPQDDGGSITLEWGLSLDDGAGGQSVKSYTIQRRTGTSGGFAKIGEVKAGVDFYEDKSVDDGVDYYYRVGASDGTNVSYAGPVGPVQAVDNLPPPVVTGLTARDVPGDNGGAIVLSWSSYSPPADCTGYRIYRDQYPFDSVGGRDPLHEIADPRVKQYVDAQTVDFTDYYYAVVAVDAAGNANENVQVAGPVQSLPNTTMTLGAGTWLLSSPVVPTDGDPSSLFGADSAFRCAAWDQANERYLVASAGQTLPDLVRLVLGRSLWVWLDKPLDFEMIGQTASAGNLSLNVGPGWQMLGNPYFAPMDYSATQVEVGGVVMSLLAAEQDGYLSAAAHLFDPVSFSYKLLSPTWTGSTLIPPWSGFWLKVDRQCKITFRRPDGTKAAQLAGVAGPAKVAAVTPSSSVQTPKQIPTVDWKIGLAAVGARGKDTDNFAGVSAAGAVPAALEPPPAPGCPRLWFENEAAPAAAVALRPASRLVWRLALLPATGEDRTWVEAQIGADVPDAYDIILRDLDNNRSVDLRRQRRVEIVGTMQRRLELQVTRRGAPALAVTSMSVQPGRGRAEIVFSLSAPAYCDVEVLNIAGRTVRRIQQQCLMTSGQQVVVWDGRGDAGTPVPRGVYLVRLRARAEDGSIVQGIRPMSLLR